MVTSPELPDACPHCGLIVHFSQLGVCHNDTTHDFGGGMPARTWVEVYACDGCEGPVALALHRNSSGEIVNAMRWPPASTVPAAPADVPEPIAALYIEAHACLSVGATTAAIVMARATVEAVAKERNVRNGNLAGMIQSLLDNDHITELLKEAADVVRLSGNLAVHEVMNERFTSQETSDVLDLVGKILKHVYQDAAAVARMRQWIDERRHRPASSI
ncbi:DUF4145 domain-containing protein [Microbispora sp. GKU 823]|uniref:DUF4145 domain-containing protein n=1 Tax=Microbispora sp. GKU 823 TaxID=1652100 RepID=UPI0009D2ADF3|nr:DUF4145 domain-containing protein [Microbispora sp. GKU 823]OPG04059.1 hypothetical protein B1L11_38630 [Microbispora sp. GKU 823]